MLDYYRRQGREVPCHLLAGTSLLCHCYQVSKETVREAIERHGLETIEDVTHHTKAGGGCGDCHHEIADLLRECREQLRADEAAGRARGDLQDLAPLPAATDGAHAAAVATAPAADEPALVARIRELLAEDIAPALRHDGGDIEFVRWQEPRVFVRLTGACAACRASDATIKGWVEAQLREFVDERIEVIEVS
jgi:NifU-like protein